MTFLQRIKAVGLSKRELAERLGLSYSTVTHWSEEPPQYAVAYIELCEKVCKLAREL